MTEPYTPTTEQVRYGFAVDPEAEYRDPLTNHTLHGERAFDRWLSAHDAEVKAAALAPLQPFLDEPCERIAYDGSCLDVPAWSPSAPYTNDRYCARCRVVAALAGHDVTLEDAP